MAGKGERKEELSLPENLIAAQCLQRAWRRRPRWPPDYTLRMIYGEELDHPTAGEEASTRDRLERGILHRVPSLGYSELHVPEFLSLLKITERLNRKPHRGVFLEIGCGTGKLVFAAAMHYSFQSSIGIELLPSLVDICREAEDFFHRRAKGRIHDHKKSAQISFLERDFFATPWPQATVVLINATLFDDDERAHLSMLCSGLPPETLFIVTSRPLPSSKLSIKSRVEFEVKTPFLTCCIMRPVCSFGASLANHQLLSSVPLSLSRFSTARQCPSPGARCGASFSARLRMKRAHSPVLSDRRNTGTYTSLFAWTTYTR